MKLKIFSGHRKGTHEFPPEVAQEKAEKWLSKCREFDWQWKVDFDSAANDEEMFWWMREDMIQRIIRAFQSGRKVVFRNKEYRMTPDCDQLAVVIALEEAVAVEGFFVRIDRDDAKGVFLSLWQEKPWKWN